MDNVADPVELGISLREGMTHLKSSSPHRFNLTPSLYLLTEETKKAVTKQE
ncbi:hypothetical protein CCACVL1_17853 [Corchorus capsularis]|uniref:Uncharacterized protein n=1 Tax=Corchorus capsularis TaxID=210143 RepID=A0A1R3HPX0_COCAP|nr:hypothetical protein CCACVL1_17853 [Corchorus capsularis]